MKSPMKARGAQTGLSMIEVLIALVILLVGLLGLAGMMMQSQRAETESYQRTQALILLQDMASRINTNRKVASCYAVSDASSGAPFLGNDTTIATPACAAGTAAQQALAIQDLQDWSDLLKGASELSTADAKMGAMIGARGCVSFDAASGLYMISVSWQGLAQTVAPPANWNCAAGQYSDEKQRRVVSITLSIADLG